MDEHGIIDAWSALWLSAIMAGFTVSFQAIGWHGAATGIGMFTYLLYFAASYNLAESKPRRFDPAVFVKQYRIAKATYKRYTTEHSEVIDNER